MSHLANTLVNDGDILGHRSVGKIGDTIKKGKEKAKGIIDDLRGDIAEWYSLHLLTYCEGQFKDTERRGLKVMKCKQSTPGTCLPKALMKSTK